MRKAALMGVLLLFAVGNAFSQDSVVTWRQIVGIIQPGNVVGSGTGAVTGGSLPWNPQTLGGARVNLARADSVYC
jgi:hypothetical protein